MPPAAADAQHNDCSDPAVSCGSPRARSTTSESTTTSLKAVDRLPSTSMAAASTGPRTTIAIAAHAPAPAWRGSHGPGGGRAVGAPRGIAETRSARFPLATDDASAAAATRARERAGDRRHHEPRRRSAPALRASLPLRP